jgi:hypothetical protein|tara:strand:- start:249 stop:572 length:324 start_codon:yes stop_codon:yes gene_type:complete
MTEERDEHSPLFDILELLDNQILVDAEKYGVRTDTFTDATGTPRINLMDSSDNEALLNMYGSTSAYLSYIEALSQVFDNLDYVELPEYQRTKKIHEGIKKTIAKLLS